MTKPDFAEGSRLADADDALQCIAGIADGDSQAVVASGPSAEWCEGWLARYREDPPTCHVEAWTFEIVHGPTAWDEAVKEAREQRALLAAVSDT